MGGFDLPPIDPEQFRIEIEAAVDSKKHFPPLYTVSGAIRDMVHSADTAVAGIPSEYWLLLADFLSGECRKKQGEKTDREENRLIDMDRARAFLQYWHEGMSFTQAKQKLLKSEKLADMRSIDRSVERGFRYIEREIEEEERRSNIEAMKRELEQWREDQAQERELTLKPFTRITGT